ncbi:MAG: hypothetical protein HC936_04490 [Leptolyngbyaceae cyanobacterium SU_3_3]|nr:hypothetical protein [Leptolyngbyaceae cyanobacterium SU_3_3]
MSDAAKMNGEQERGAMPGFDMNASHSGQMPVDASLASAGSMSDQNQMPVFGMGSTSTQSGGMQPREMNGGERPTSGLQSVLVEIRLPKDQSMAAMQLVQARTPTSFHLDESYDAISMTPPPEVAGGC